MGFEQIQSFYSKLQDEESRRLFEIKLEELIRKENNGTLFIDFLADDKCNWCLSEYDNFLQNREGRRVIIRGAGAYGKLTWVILKSMNVEVECFCDNSAQKQASGFCGKKVISEAELIWNYRDRLVIIASRTNGAFMYRDLISKSFPRENVFLPRNGALFATRGNQYFDCPELLPEEDEVFIDCGCFDAGTSEYFSQWCNGNYERIIAFEPDSKMYAEIQRKCTLDRFQVLPYATGAARETAAFNSTSDGGSRIAEVGKDLVQVESIDNILQGEKATFIKLDVEGAELETLKGAVNTIKIYKPRLAISIYHKPEDIWNIPQFLEETRDDYKYYIRHYTSCTWETILYAV